MRLIAIFASGKRHEVVEETGGQRAGDSEQAELPGVVTLLSGGSRMLQARGHWLDAALVAITKLCLPSSARVT